MLPQKEQEQITLLHAVTGKFGKFVELTIGNKSNKKFKEVIKNINPNINPKNIENEQR